MRKKYLMFIDENGFWDFDNDFYMIGIIFEECYCITDDKNNSELKKIVDENDFDIYKSLENKNISKGCILRNEVYNILKDSRFSVIISEVKNDEITNLNKSIEAFNRLLKKYYYYTIDNYGEKSGIIVEAKESNRSILNEQELFNAYLDRNCNLKSIYNCGEKINEFRIVNRDDEKYGLVLNISKIISESIKYNFIRKQKENREYRYSDRMNEKIMEVIKDKVFTEEIAFDISRKNLINKSKHLLMLESKVINLEKQLLNKNNHIKDKNSEIAELSKEIKVLKQQLYDVALKTNNNILFEILSDVDVKINNIAK